MVLGLSTKIPTYTAPFIFHHHFPSTHTHTKLWDIQSPNHTLFHHPSKVVPCLFVAIFERKQENKAKKNRTITMQLLDPIPPLEPMVEATTWLRDTSVATAAMGVTGGYLMGVAFSMFGSMISVETTTQAMGARDFFRYSLKSAHRLGMSFGYFGFIFGGLEVALEKRRGKKDIWNPAASGLIFGGAYGWRAYRRVGLVGGAIGGCAFSMLADYAMNKFMG